MNKFRRFSAVETCLKMHYFGHKSPKSPSAGVHTPIYVQLL